MSYKEGLLYDFQHTGMSYLELGEKYGLERITVAKMIQRSGLQRVVSANSKGGRTPFDDQPVLSKMHQDIGTKVNLHRTLKLKENLTEFAPRLMTNRYKLRQLELGKLDLTLTQLNYIAQLLSTSVTDLVTPRKESYGN